MSKYYTYRWASGCESALIEGPGLGHGMEVTDLMDRELAATCERMDKAYEAGLNEGAGLNEAVADVVAPKPSTDTIIVPLSWFENWHRVEPAEDELREFRRIEGLDDHLARLEYLEQVMVRSLFRQVAGDEPTDDAMKARITVERYHDRSYAYVLDRKVQGYPHGGTLLLMCETPDVRASKPGKLLLANYHSPYFVK
jgi:hypothetical protein